MAVPDPSRGVALMGDVRSETGLLRRVLVHRPGRELDRLTAENATALLFDDDVCAGSAREEHDLLVEVLVDEGVEVLAFSDLLTGTLRYEEARTRALDLATVALPRGERAAVADRLAALDPPELAEAIVAGATYAELEIEAPGTPDPEFVAPWPQFAVPPLPNLMFVRDTSAWLGGALVLGAGANPIRARETAVLTEVYRSHPVFAGISERLEGAENDAVEGGDLFCVDERTALVGISARTSAVGVEVLAERLFAGGFEQVFAIPIPRRRSSIHLDCLMTLVDDDVILADGRLLDRPVIELLPPGGRVSARHATSLPAALGSVLGVEVQIVEVVGRDEQWTMAANVVALAPGRVIAYSQNVRTNAALAAAGIEVLAIPGEELSRGHGGPRCLTCPLSRDGGGG